MVFCADETASKLKGCPLIVPQGLQVLIDPIIIT